MLLCFCTSGKSDRHVMGGEDKGSYDSLRTLPVLTHTPTPRTPCIAFLSRWWYKILKSVSSD